MITYQFYDFCPSGSDFDCIEVQSCYKVNKFTPINCETTKSGKCKHSKESKFGTIKKDKSHLSSLAITPPSLTKERYDERINNDVKLATYEIDYNANTQQSTAGLELKEYLSRL